MRVLVLGCGEMGATAVEDLYEYGPFDELTVATRTLSRATRVLERLSGKPILLTQKEIDASDVGGLASLVRGHDVVVNCIGPNYQHEVNVARAAIAERVHLVDINDDYETTFEMLRLDEDARRAGITVVLGLGASPGLNNVLVRAAANQLDTVDEIHTAWVMSGPDPGGLALSYHLLHSLSGRALTVQDGETVEVRSFIDGRERIRFPDPVGSIDVYHVGHPEPITLFRTFPSARCVDDKATFNPPWVNELILQLGTMKREAGEPVQVGATTVDPMDFAASLLHARCKRITGYPKEGALRVSVVGRKGNGSRRVNFSSAGRITFGTGIPASVGAAMIARGEVQQRGILPPEACIDPHDFLYELFTRRNVATLNGWVEEL